MKIFIAASYSSEVDYASGQVFDDYREWLEGILQTIEHSGYNVFCALREDNYQINKGDPAAAYCLDMENIKKCDAIIALLDNNTSAGVQTEIGIAVALGKRVVLAHKPEDALSYFNAAMVYAGVVQELELPIAVGPLHAALKADPKHK